MQSSNKGTILLVVLLALSAAVYVFFPSLSQETSSEMNTPATTTPVVQKNIISVESIIVGKSIAINDNDIIMSNKRPINPTGSYTIVSTKKVEIPDKNIHNVLFEACYLTGDAIFCRFFVRNSHGEVVELPTQVETLLSSAADKDAHFQDVISNETKKDILNSTDETKVISEGVRISTSTLPYIYLVTSSVSGDVKEYRKVSSIDTENIQDGKSAEQILASSLIGVTYDTFDNGAERDEDGYTYSFVGYEYGLHIGNVFRSVQLRENFATTTKKRETTLSVFENSDIEHAKVLLHEVQDGTKSAIDGKSDTTNLDKNVIFTIGKKNYTYNFETNTLTP